MLGIEAPSKVTHYSRNDLRLVCLVCDACWSLHRNMLGGQACPLPVLTWFCLSCNCCSRPSAVSKTACTRGDVQSSGGGGRSSSTDELLLRLKPKMRDARPDRLGAGPALSFSLPEVKAARRSRHCWAKPLACTRISDEKSAALGETSVLNRRGIPRHRRGSKKGNGI